jgi:5'-nucleotidase
MPPDVDVLKVDVPCEATTETPWEITRISRVRLFEAIPPQRDSWSQPGRVGYRFAEGWEAAKKGTDIHAMKVKETVSVTPLSLDLTSRINLNEFERDLRS